MKAQEDGNTFGEKLRNMKGTQTIRMPITAWPENDRPREKMAAMGGASLTETELLATLLGTGTHELSAIDLAREILATMGGLSRIALASIHDLMQVRGVGHAKASSIVAAFELSRREATQERRPTAFIAASLVGPYLVSKIGHLRVEVFYVLYLDTRKELIAEEELHRGGTLAVTVDGKELFRKAIAHGAASVIVSHNHPSGKLDPSQKDDELTRHLLQLSKITDIGFTDHIIVTKNRWFSYREEGMPKVDEGVFMAASDGNTWSFGQGTKPNSRPAAQSIPDKRRRARNR